MATQASPQKAQALAQGKQQLKDALQTLRACPPEGTDQASWQQLLASLEALIMAFLLILHPQPPAPPPGP